MRSQGFGFSLAKDFSKWYLGGIADRLTKLFIILAVFIKVSKAKYEIESG